MLIAVRPPVAVGPAAVVLLRELLLFALQVVFEDDAPNREPVVLVSKPGFLLAVRRVELDVAVTVTHQQWRERYRFTAGHRWTEIDFVYSAKGRITNATVRQTAGADVALGRQIATLIDQLRG